MKPPRNMKEAEEQRIIAMHQDLCLAGVMFLFFAAMFVIFGGR